MSLYHHTTFGASVTGVLNVVLIPSVTSIHMFCVCFLSLYLSAVSYFHPNPSSRPVWAHGQSWQTAQYGHMAIRGAGTRGIRRKPRKGILGSNRRCSGRGTRLPRTSPRFGTGRRQPFSLFFPAFRVLPCAHTEWSANFGHVPIPAGSLGCPPRSLNHTVHVCRQNIFWQC